MDIASYLKGATGDFLGFLGIAITYVIMGITEIVDKRKGSWLWFLPGAAFIVLAIFSLTIGTTTLVDTGKVLGYMGIGTGLICTSWSMHADRNKSKPKYIASWTILIIGELSIGGAAALEIPSKLISSQSLLLIGLLVICIYAIYKNLQTDEV